MPIVLTLLDGVRWRGEPVVGERPQALLAALASGRTIRAERLAEEIWADTGGEVDAIIGGIGTGGTLTGIARVLKPRRKGLRIIGVEPEGANLIRRSLDAGTCLSETPHSIADGLSAPFTAPLTQSIIEHYVDDVVVVSDEEILHGLVTILERSKILVEPSGAAAVAALLTGKAGVAAGTKTVAVLSGGNIDHARLKSLL